jgi:hypothetical protein
MSADSKSKPLHENLDTTFVNLWSLLRSLTQKHFVGRVHVELKDYSADIFMNGASTPMVREMDHLAGTETIEEASLHRVVLRARETPGTISVFEGADEAVTAKTNASNVIPPAPPVAEGPVLKSQSEVVHEIVAVSPPAKEAVKSKSEVRSFASAIPPTQVREDLYPTGSYRDWPAILGMTGELIAAIERAINATGGKFDLLFAAVRLELADDYSFFDPTSRTFDYANGAVSMSHNPAVSAFVSGLSEALRRTVDRAATGDRSRRVRERVALEMLTVARKRSEVLERSGLGPQLDRIAGTRVR